jgi:hypothetical protein
LTANKRESLTANKKGIVDGEMKGNGRIVELLKGDWFVGELKGREEGTKSFFDLI